jgi:hypothetical protein
MDVDSKSEMYRGMRHQVLLAVILTLSGGVVGAAYGWMRIPDVLGFAWMLTGIVLVVMSFPLWGAHEWARVTVASTASAMALAHVIVVFATGANDREFGASIASITYAAYFWLPSTRDTLKETRESMERARAARRGLPVR